MANAPYNGMLGAGASTTFGFVGNGSAPGSPNGDLHRFLTAHP